MKIIFIRPSMAGKKSADALKPLAFSVLCSLTPETVETEFYDERVEKLPPAFDGDAICFSVETFTAKRAYMLAAKYKNRNPAVKIIMGGFHPTACPDEAAQFADCVVVGDAEPVWARLTDDLLNNRLRPRYISSNSYMLPFSETRKSVFQNKKYANIGVTQWKRGCVFNCNFCSVRAFYKSSVIERDIDDVVSEIKNMKEKIVFITDDNLLHDRDKLKEFLVRLIPLKKKWACQISVNIVNDDEVLALMAKSGCIVALVGFESLNANNLAEIGKKQNIANNDYAKAIEKIYSYRIMIYATFIFGYPHDTLKSFDDVYSFAMKQKFFITNFNPLMAMPSTDLYADLQKQGKLINDKWWLSDDYSYGDAMHAPENYSAKQLADGCKRLRYKFYSFAGIIKRMTNPVNFRYLHLYMLLNIVSAVEIRRKQQIKLGGAV